MKSKRRPGALITFEGGEASGKSTQFRRIEERLREDGLEVVVVREPGGTTLGERIRDVLLDPAHPEMTAWTELFLYLASRAQLAREVIRPALERGAVVLADRYADSSVAYQGGGRGLPPDEIHRLNAVATDGLVPDLTVVFDLPPQEGRERQAREQGTSTSAGRDRIEKEAGAFHERVRNAYLEAARAEPDRVVVISGAGSIEEIARRVEELVRKRLPKNDAAEHPAP